jgi:hypothetical protein
MRRAVLIGFEVDMAMTLRFIVFAFSAGAYLGF